VMDPAMAPAIVERSDMLVAAMSPWATGGSYLNFSERGGEAASLHDEETYGRLRRARATHDADELLVSSHPIPAA